MPITARNQEELPLTLKVEQVAEVLGISRKVAYNLTRQPGFPAVRVGEKRIVVPRDRFLLWLDENADNPIE